jgi:hypothetical protein
VFGHNVTKKTPAFERGLSSFREPSPFLAAIPVIHFLGGLVLGIAIALLKPALELILLAARSCSGTFSDTVRRAERKRSHLIALRTTKISPSDPPSHWRPGSVGTNSAGAH